jgi:aerobic-type carbon monoxide dehydrogenase small subunit (CoxS/CutS family)
MVPGGRGKEFDSDDEDDDEDVARAAQGHRRRFTEFECPTCSAHNPVGDAFGNGDDVFCGYCGQSFVALVDEDGALRLKET